MDKSIKIKEIQNKTNKLIKRIYLLNNKSYQKFKIYFYGFFLIIPQTIN